ncbi:MAG: D-alanyl-D-alanine carboxypeptidase [Candidatus Ryanbacteria bacterium]|nr:D-alanyl-D-alanine carboxypeptidase [Candidatus Ryanbacteria bacterium]
MYVGEKQKSAPPSTTIPDNLSARSILLFDLADERPIAGQNEGDIIPIASLSKIMTGYIALKLMNAEEKIEFSEGAVKTSGTSGNFRKGEIFSLRDLLFAAMMYSSNDAASAMAEKIGEYLGGRDFEEKIALAVERMNTEAKGLGMEHTTFVNPTGLDFDINIASNYSSAKDLMKLIFATKQTPLLWDASRPKEKTIYSSDGQAHRLININQTLARLSHALGGKTGSTDSAQESIVLLYEFPLGHPKGLILLGTGQGRRFQEAENILGGLMPMLL